ncbi:MAG: c-type cytochrome [Chryseolinea sp.]
MIKFLKIAGYVVLSLAVLIGAIIVYIKNAMPDVGPPENLKVELTPARIERGHYLAWSVSVCMDCHSTRDWSKFSGPIIPGKIGQGGERFDQNAGLPGAFFSRNITPEGISRYTDGELYRVITTGVTKEGRAMFPLMPYPYYGKMDREDIMSIIAYVRTIEPVKNDVPPSVPDFPMSVIINTIPHPATPMPMPDPSDQLAYGEYLVNAASCVECHTPFEKGKIVQEFRFGGGREFTLPDKSVVRSANITPNETVGIGKWSVQQFVSRFKLFADSSYVAPSVKPGEFNTVMPWSMYSHMKEDDLKAIYAYLKTVDPVDSKISIFTAAAKP